MKYYRLLKNVGNGFRLILLILALIGTALLIKWPYSLQGINRYDDKVIRTYEKTHQSAYLRASELELIDPNTAIDAYENFLVGAERINKDDRLYPLKRKAFRNLLFLLSATEQFEKKLYWANLWAKTDARDVYAQVQYGLALYKTKKNKARAVQLLTGLFQKFPESKLIADAYANILLDGGALDESFAVLIENYRLQLAQKFTPFGWEIFWGFGDGFLASNRKSVWAKITSSGVVTIAMEVPLQATEYRIDVPASLGIVVLDPTLSVYRNQQQIKSTAIGEHSLVLKQMVLRNNALTADGGDDPFFAWKLPASFRKNGDKLVFQAELRHSPSKLLTRLITSARVADIEQSLLQSNDLDTLALLRNLKAQGKPAAPTEK